MTSGAPARRGRGSPLRYCVVGGGISGLVAAYRIRGALGERADITVFDPADRLGGVLRTVQLAGVPVDIEIYAGVVHGFINFGRAIPQALTAHNDAARALRQAFQEK